MINDTVYGRLSKIKGEKSFSEVLNSILNELKSEKLAAFQKIKGILTEKEVIEAYRRIKELKKHAQAET